MKKFLLLVATAAMTLSASAQSKSFQLDFYQQVAKAQTGENVVVSPLSAQLSLSLLAEGAGGETLTALLNTLGYANAQELEEANLAACSAMEKMENGVEFETANSIWTVDEVTLKNSFVDNCMKYYNAESLKANIREKTGIDAMNKWAAQHTSGRITDLELAPDAERRLMMVNTVFMSAPFYFKFDKDETKKKAFKNADGSVVEVSMMEDMNTYRFAVLEDFDVVELPLGQEDLSSCSMLLFSNRHGDYSQLVDTQVLKDALRMIGWDSKVWVRLPRFEVKKSIDVTSVLKKMGLEKIYTDADFSNMTVSPVKLNQTKQIVTFGADEEGISGAAATLHSFSTGAPIVSLDMNLNHPFQFVVVEKERGTVLFAGAVNKLEGPVPQGIDTVTCSTPATIRYDLSGRKVSGAVQNGVIIENGRKVIR